MANTDIDIRIIVRDEFSKQLAKLNKDVKKSGDGWRLAGQAAQAASVVVVAALGASVKAAGDYQKQLATVATMLGDQANKFMPKYSTQLRKMAVGYGESTATLSKGLFDILSASVPAGKALDVLAVSAKAARGGLTTTGVAADAITTILNSYSLEAEKATEVSDLLFSIVARGKTTFAELAPNIGRVASTAAQSGLSLEEMGASLATMTRSGLKTDVAITSLRGIMAAMLKPTDEAAKVFKDRLGFSLDSAAIKAKGLTGIVQELKQAGLTPDEIAAMFPQEALQGLNVLLGNSAGFLKDRALMLDRAGSSQAAFNTMTNTFNDRMDKAKAVVKDAAISLGTELLPILTQVADEWINNAGSIANAAAELGKFVEGAIKGIQKLADLSASLFTSSDAAAKMAENNKSTARAMQDVGIRVKAMTDSGMSLADAYKQLDKQGVAVDDNWRKQKFSGEQLIAGSKALETQTKNTTAAQKEQTKVQKEQNQAQQETFGGSGGAPPPAFDAEAFMSGEENKLAIKASFAEASAALDIATAEQKSLLLEAELQEVADATQEKLGLNDKQFLAFRKSEIFKAKIAEWRLGRDKKIAKAEFEMKVATAQSIAANTLAAIQTVIGTEQGAFNKRKGITLALIAIEKGLAIARIWSANAVNPAVAAAKTALVTAQFAQQTGLVGGTNIDTSALPTTAIGTSPTGQVGGGTEALPSAAASGAIGGGGGGRGGVSISLGGVFVTLSIENLENLSEEQAENMLISLGQGIKHKVGGAVQFALASADLAEKNAGLAT